MKQLPIRVCGMDFRKRNLETACIVKKFVEGEHQHLSMQL